MNKTTKVIEHLKIYGSITSWEAIKDYGITRLSAIIYTLRWKYHMNIISQQEQFTDRYGDKSYFARYILEEGE